MWLIYNGYKNKVAFETPFNIIHNIMHGPHIFTVCSAGVPLIVILCWTGATWAVRTRTSGGHAASTTTRTSRKWTGAHCTGPSATSTARVRPTWQCRNTSRASSTTSSRRSVRTRVACSVPRATTPPCRTCSPWTWSRSRRPTPTGTTPWPSSGLGDSPSSTRPRGPPLKPITLQARPVEQLKRTTYQHSVQFVDSV